MKLDEAAIRAKVIELLDRCDSNRMDAWLLSGTAAGVVDADIAARVMNEELWRRSHDVQRFWLGACNCHGELN